MKVLLVNTVPTERNGVTGVVFNCLRAFRCDDMHVDLVAINEPDKSFTDAMEEVNGKVYVIPREIRHPLKYVRRLTKIARGYDIIHVHGNSATMVLEMVAARLAGVRLRIAHSHNTTCSMKSIDRIFRPLFYALCNARLACGVEAGKWLYGKRNFKVLNNGIDTGRFRYDSVKRTEIRKHLGIGDSYVIGHVGNFVEQKNHGFLIEVFHEILRLHPDARLMLLGSGALMDSIKTKAVNLGIIDRIIFLGSKDNPQDYFNAMDMVIMPSLFEGLPLTLVEEQANGLTVLAADTITADSDMTGLVNFESLEDSPSEWAKHAAKILESSVHDDNTSAKAIKMIKSAGYDIAGVAESLLAFYRKELDNCR